MNRRVSLIVAGLFVCAVAALPALVRPAGASDVGPVGGPPIGFFDGCGTIVEGVECTLFSADSGGLYVVANLGGFGEGARVRVVGEIDFTCITFCQQGNGCIFNNTIEACGEPLGRCCFLGIVPEPILCEVTTEAMCFQFAAPVSWTPGLTCDDPCDGPQIVTGCGILAIGPQGCVLFQGDAGDVYAVGNTGGFVPGDRVWVSGVVNPNSFLCFPATIPGIDNNQIGACFEGCGTLVQGVECVLFQADAGGLYVLDNTGGFSVGDRVEVSGCLDVPCLTFCQQGNGCIRNNTIVACVEQTFSDCGTLAIGPQGCILFLADSGATFAIGNTGGFGPGDRAWVSGTVTAGSFLCFPVVIPAIENNTISVCFDRCGRLVQGAGGCILFRSQGKRYILDNLGGFRVGDRVRVRGCLNPQCLSVCPQNDGCIEDNLIESCHPGGTPQSSSLQ